MLALRRKLQQLMQQYRLLVQRQLRLLQVMHRQLLPHLQVQQQEQCLVRARAAHVQVTTHLLLRRDHLEQVTIHSLQVVQDLAQAAA